MKPKLDKKLFKFSVYTTGTAIAIYIAFKILGNFDSILLWLQASIMYIGKLLKPLLVGLIIAYLFYPLVHGFEKFMARKNIFKKVKTRRVIGIILSYLIVISIVVALACGIYVMIGGKLSNNLTVKKIVDYISVYIQDFDFSLSSVKAALAKLNIPIPSNMDEMLLNIVEKVKDYVTFSLGSATSSIIDLGGNIVSFFLAFIISIYLLLDTEYFINIWKKFYYMIFRKSKTGKVLTEICLTVHHTFTNYLKGQFIDALIVGLLSSVALSIVGVDYAIVIGLISGICNMIPYIGPIIGTVLACIMALLSGQPITILWAIIAMIIVQQLDNNLIAPKIVGDSVGIHPIIAMVALIIGGKIGGLAGMLLSVPIAAAAKTLIGKWYDNNIDYPKLADSSHAGNDDKAQKNIFSIREAVLTDAKAIGNIHYKAWYQTYRFVFPKSYLDLYDASKREEEFINCFNSSSAKYYVMYQSDTPIGIIKLSTLEKAIEIQSIYILKEFRHKGYGSKAIQYIKDTYPDSKLQLYVIESNKNAKQFYESVGFNKTSNVRTINRGKDFIQEQYETSIKE